MTMIGREGVEGVLPFPLPAERLNLGTFHCPPLDAGSLLRCHRCMVGEVEGWLAVLGEACPSVGVLLESFVLAYFSRNKLYETNSEHSRGVSFCCCCSMV